MGKALAVTGLVFAGISAVVAAPAHADPSMRFGLTLGFDSVAPDPVLGPEVAVGERLGRFVGELEYAYLSFFSDSRIQRVGVTLRADVLRDMSPCKHFACTRASSWFVEGGAAQRYGEWEVPGLAPVPARSPELHVGLGYELDNGTAPKRNGWQLGLRLAFARLDSAGVMTTCRGTGCGAPTTVPTNDRELLVEWMYLLGD